MCGYRIAHIEVLPLRYQPVIGRIEILTRLVYELEYDGSARPAAVTERQRHVFGEAVRRTVVNSYQLVRQAIGCLMTVLVQESDGELYSFDDFCAEAWGRFAGVVGTLNVPDAMHKKAMEWYASGPSEMFSDFEIAEC